MSVPTPNMSFVMRTALAAAGFVALLAAGPAQTPPAATRAFDLYLLGHSIGQELRTIAPLDDGRRVTFDFRYVDRGTEVSLASTLELARDGSPRRFVSKGRTYRYFNTDCEVSVTGTRVHVRDAAREYDLDTGGKPFFPLDSFAPVGMHEEILKYWLTHGRPADILTAPAGPLHITSHGQRPMSVGEGDNVFPVERLSIDGAVWGRETVFIVAAGHQLAGNVLGFFSWAGGLGFEAVAYTNADHYDVMANLAIADRMADLQAWTKSRELAPLQTGTFAVVGATVIDGTDGPAIPNATLVIRDGRIAAVGPSASTPAPRGVATVDAAGQFVIPGLWDMHAHVGQIDWGPAYLASGVTTIRDMGGEFPFLKAYKDALAAGALGPRLLNAGLIDGPGARAFGRVSVSTADEARAAVRKYRDAGFEQIKVYLAVPPDLVPVITDEAHRLGMTVTGHVPTGMTQDGVIAAGFDSIAHMSLRGAPGSPEAAASIASLKSHQIVIDPTLSWNEFLNRPATTPLSSIHPDIDRLPPTLTRLLSSTTPGNAGRGAASAGPPASWRLLAEGRNAGLVIVAGTDKGIPGFSLAREVEIYAEGGMTPLQALQSATIQPARAMKLDKDTGTLEVGKRADFVLLASNPLLRVSAIRNPKSVAVNGRLYDTAPLWRAAGFRPPGR
jgi:imidazolonepropionase-like amidohydrolase